MAVSRDVHIVRIVVSVHDLRAVTGLDVASPFNQDHETPPDFLDESRQSFRTLQAAHHITSRLVRRG